MRASEVFGLIANGIIKPEAEIAVELGVTPVKLTLKLRAGDLQKLMLDTRAVTNVLRRCFGQRRIFRDPLDAEPREICIASAKEIVETLRAVQAELPAAGANSALHTLLGKWEDLSVDARQKLEGPSKIPAILREYRVRSLPIIEALISMLPKDAEVRHDAENKIEETRRSLPGPDLAHISDSWRIADDTQ